MVHFPQVAGLAQGLGVQPFVCATVKDGDDVIQDQVCFGTTERTGLAGPLPSLSRGKVLPVATKLWLFVKRTVHSSWDVGQHKFSVLFPSFFERDGEPVLCLLRSLRPGLSFLRGGFSLLGIGHLLSDVFRVCFVPVRVAFSAEGLPLACLGTRFREVPLPAAYLSRASVERCATNSAVERLAESTGRNGSLSHATPPTNNRVNSVEHSYDKATIGHLVGRVNTEPSRVGNGTEGATARGRAYSGNATAVIAPTSARPERDDIA